jgi:hypothetical protein
MISFMQTPSAGARPAASGPSAPAVESDSRLPIHHDHRNSAASAGPSHHCLQAAFVASHIDVFHIPAFFLVRFPSRAGEGSRGLSENDDAIFHKYARQKIFMIIQ